MTTETAQVTTTIRETVTVQPGGVVVVRQPWLPPGARVEVQITIPGTLPQAGPTPSLEEIQRGFGQALAEAGYDTREKIVELVREVKREQADERARARGQA